MPRLPLLTRPSWLPRIDAVTAASVVALTVTLALVLATAMRSPLKDDVAWLLYVARRWLAGQQLYVDVVEVNPPLIIWICAIPELISERLGVAPKMVAAPFFAALLLGSAWWSATLLRGTGALFVRRLPVFAAIGSVLLVLPGVEFGQREHLLVAAALPYLCLFARVQAGEREPLLAGALTGALAGLGCALKPTYAPVFAFVELIGLLRGATPFRPAPMAAVATGALYAAAVVVFCPAFLDKAVPLALALYGATDTPWWDIVSDSRGLLFAEAVLLLLCWYGRQVPGRQERVLRALIWVLAAFALGSTISYVLQGKNWFYHRLPAAIATTLGLMLWTGFLLVRRPGQFRRLLLPAPCALAALLVLAQGDVVRLRPWVMDAVEPDNSTEVKLERLIKREKAQTYIAFSEWIGLGFPVVNDTGVVWASRFDSMWAVRGELWRTRQDGAAPKQWPIRHWVARDFIANCPDLVVVDSREGINWVAVLVASDPAFARTWSYYRQIAAFDGLRVLKRHGNACIPVDPAARGRSHQASAAGTSTAG